MEKTEASLLNKKAGEKKFSTSEIWKNNKMGFHNKWGKVSGTKEKKYSTKGMEKQCGKWDTALQTDFCSVSAC